MDLIWSKVIAMFLSGGIPIILSLLPLFFKTQLVPVSRDTTKGWRAVLTSVLLCFGAGVLLATSMVHMLPEVQYIALIVILSSN